MSGYWDAILGAAFGRAGTARPLEPAPFAGDPEAGFTEVEERVDARAPTAQAIGLTPLRVAGATAPAQIEAEPAPDLPAAVPTARNADASEPTPTAPPAQDRSAEPARPIAALTSEPRERLIMVEERRIETRVEDGRPRSEPDRAAPIAPKWMERAELPPTVAEPVPPRDDAPLPPASEAPPREILLVAAEPVTAPAPAVEDAPREPAPEPLVIEIGRIDVRIVAPPVAVAEAPKPARAEAVPSLADYLARRSEARR